MAEIQGMNAAPAGAGWRRVRAGEIGRFGSGSGFPLRYQGRTDGDYPFFKVSDMNRDGNDVFLVGSANYISDETRKILGAVAFPPKSIVFAKVGAAVFLDRKRILTQRSCLDNNMAAFVPTDEGVDPSFVYFLLLTIRFSAFASTTALPALSGTVLSGIQLPLPPVPEQRAIAAVLSDVDELVGSLEALVAKKRAIKEAAMRELLTGRTRLPGFGGEWTPKRLGELGSFLKGSGVRREEAQSGHLACVRYGEIYTVHDHYVRAFHSRISPGVAQSATRLEYGDLLFAGSGETKEEIGKSVALAHDVVAYAGGDVLILRQTGADPRFLGYASNAPRVAKQKASLGQGDAVVHINSTALEQVTLELPTPEEQRAIADVLSDMDDEVAALERQLAKTRAIKLGMMQELLTGRVRLPLPPPEQPDGGEARDA